MPHGDFSDYTAYAHLTFGIASMYKPELWWKSIGPIQALLTGTPTADAEKAVRMAGGLLLLIGFVFYVVRWNTVSGRYAAGPACVICALNAMSIAATSNGGIRTASGWHLYASLMLLSAMHFMLNPNPVWTSKTLKKHEDEKAAKKAAKNR